ncbi:lytic transglycosylase domain-containing protein, partial [Fibrobacterota bacterium]
DSGRIERMASGQMMDQRDLRMIKSASETYKKSRKKGLIWISAISVIAIITVSVLAIQNLSYKRKLEQQKKLLTNISDLNKKLDKEVENPHMDDEERFRMAAKLRAQERILSKLRGKLASKDLVQLYKDPLGVEIHRAMEQFGESDYIVPDIFIEQVKKYLKSWQRNPRFLRTAFRNKAIHAEMINRELEKANMPLAFLYLAIHESGLDSTIISRAGARGIWQFMPRTGRDYGLKVHNNWRKVPVWLDERTNPRKSTIAAIKYLKVLLGQFGTVPLAMAAYNAGEGRIMRELRKIDDPINNRDFWYIYRSGTLAEETNQYMPKIVTTMVIDKNRGKYGFGD